MKLSTSNPLWAAFLCGLSLSSCAPTTSETAPVLTVAFAALSIDNCQTIESDQIRSRIDRLIIETRSSAGEWSQLTSLDAPFDGPQEHLVTGISTATDSLRAIGCEGGRPTWLSTHPLSLSSSEKKSINLTLSPTKAMSCNGSVSDSQVNGRFEWSQPSFLAASMPISDTESLIAGGALIMDDRLRVAHNGSQASGWVVFNHLDNVFYEGAQRSQRLNDRSLWNSRVGPALVGYKNEFRRGGLVIGGAEAVQRSPEYAYGPFEPGRLDAGQFQGNCDPAQQNMIFIDLQSGGLAEVQGAAMATRRFLPGYATGENSALIVGGLACMNGEWTPSSSLDAISNGRLIHGELGIKLVGASVTDLGSDTYLVWGYSVENCGRTPGFLVQVGDDVKVRSLPGLDTEIGSPCGARPGNECRPWHATAYHAATRLKNAADGSRRVLITGGITGNNEGLVNTLSLPQTCGGNGFILSLDASGQADILPVTNTLSERLVSRAFHASQRSHDDVILNGGWVQVPAGVRECGVDDDCPDGQCYSQRCTEGMFNPVALHGAKEWAMFRSSNQLFESGGFNAVSRVGSIGIEGLGGAVTFVGGIDSSEGHRPSGLTERFTPEVDPRACLAPVPPVSGQ